jgi:hypothetical protein
MPPGPPAGTREGMTAASGTAAPRENLNLGQPELNSHYPAPPAAFPGQADCRPPAARVKDALRAPANAGQAPLTRTSSHRGKHNQRGSYPTPEKHDQPAKPHVIPT